MARFNAAVMSGAADDKFQNRYNYLLDLLDTGYIVEKKINSKLARVEISPNVGISISYDGNQKLGIDPLTGNAIFSGNLSAAGGTFTGDLSAAGGTFTGTMSAASVVSGRLESVSGDTYFDLDNGEIKLSTALGTDDVVVTMSPSDPFKVTFDGDTVAGITSDGYFAASRLMRPDVNDYFEIGPEAADNTAARFFRTVISNGTPVLYRYLEVKTSASMVTEIIKPERPHISGAGILILRCGGALFTAWDAGTGVASMEVDGQNSFVRVDSDDARMTLGNNTVGVDGTGVYKRINGGSKVYL